MRVEEEQHSRTVRKGVCDWDDEPEFQNVMTLSILPPAESAWGTSMKRCGTVGGILYSEWGG